MPAAIPTLPRRAATSVPVIDFGPFLTGGVAGRRGVAAEIGQAAREIGFFSIVNHGVPVPLIDQVLAESRRFLGRPLEEKMRIDISRSRFHRGYHPMAAEATDPKAKPDLKEAFDMALELPLDDPDVIAGKPFHGPNAWPDDLPGFRPTLEAYYASLLDLAAKMCVCFAIDLGLAEDFFVDKHLKPLAQMRLLHYPPQQGTISEDQLGAGAHTDYGSVALLAQDAAGGLEVQNAAGDWIPVPPVDGAFVCNVGDIMEIWTNGLYPATRHRVINRSGRERYSQVLFYDPDYDCYVEPLPQCCSADRPPAYAGKTMGRHLTDMFDKTFVYRDYDAAE